MVSDVYHPSQNRSMDSSRNSRASKVFGNVLSGVPDDSLCYSPSPLKENKLKRNTENCKNSAPSPKAIKFEKIGNAAGSNKENIGAVPRRSATKKDGTKNVISQKSKDSTAIKASYVPVIVNKNCSPVIENSSLNKNRTPTNMEAAPPSSKENRQIFSVQKAIDEATFSVNKSLNAVRKAKDEQVREKIAETSRIREERRAEKEEAKAFHAEAHKTKKEFLDLRNQLTTKFMKAKVEREQSQQQQRAEEMTKELLFKSDVYRHHEKDQRKAEENRKRLSIDVKSKIRQEKRDSEQRMKMKMVDEEQALLEERHESSIALSKAKAKEAEKRRKSLAFRNGDASRIRKLFAELEKKRSNMEHESFQLKWAGENDSQAYKKKCAEDRRNSFAFRKMEGVMQKAAMAEIKENISAEVHESYELKRAGEKDAEVYKKFCAEERRKSFAFRNKEGVKQRETMTLIQEDARSDEHESYELKWAGEKDAEAYKRKCAEDRRNSFAFRNMEGVKQKEDMAKIKENISAGEHESYELKRAGEKDVEAYDNLCAEERRKSFAFRNKEGVKQRETMTKIEKSMSAEAHESYELKWAGEKDAEAYERKCVEDRRNSFAFRNMEGVKQKSAMAEMKENTSAEEHESYELKRAGEKDAEAYKKLCAEERRKSFAFRNKEGAKQKKVMTQIEKSMSAEAHESYELKWAGEKDAEAYEKQCSEERREMFAFQNQEGRRQREIESQMKAEHVASEHESFSLKVAAEKDTEAYRERVAEERRNSFQFRNKEGVRQRGIDAQMKSDNLKRDHSSLELKWAGEQDAEAYKEKCAEERRNSFAFRNEEGKKHRALMEELTSIAKEKESESFVLKWAGERDAKNYLQSEAERRRESLQGRNMEGRHHREFDREVHYQCIQESADNETLKAACQQDVEDYREECASRDRASLCYRRNEARLQRLQEEEAAVRKSELEEESRELESAAREDVQEYVQRIKKRNRLSLAFRAKEKRHHKEWSKRQNEVSRDGKCRETKDRAMDARYIQLAKEKERARQAIDAIRHTGCTFASNPFASLLD